MKIFFYNLGTRVQNLSPLFCILVQNFLNKKLKTVTAYCRRLILDGIEDKDT